VVLGLPEQKFVRLHLNGKKLGMVVYTCHLRGKLKIGKFQSSLVWAKKQDSISKITITKRAGGMTQVVECLASMKP
jgi:hypothetical protein